MALSLLDMNPEILELICEYACCHAPSSKEKQQLVEIRDLWLMTTTSEAARGFAFLWTCRTIWTITAPFMVQHLKFWTFLDLSTASDELIPLIEILGPLCKKGRKNIRNLDVTVEISEFAGSSALIQYAYLWAVPEMLKFEPEMIWVECPYNSGMTRNRWLNVTVSVLPWNEGGYGGFVNGTFDGGDFSMEILLRHLRTIGRNVKRDLTITLDGTDGLRSISNAVLELIKSPPCDGSSHGGSVWQESCAECEKGILAADWREAACWHVNGGKGGPDDDGLWKPQAREQLLDTEELDKWWELETWDLEWCMFYKDVPGMYIQH
ncbi:hypothetical protein LTR17_015159 [Elasticomyces elasticus]|nr:hypothetical protein LTR17_015159 [Elasticomyces elasticus]